MDVQLFQYHFFKKFIHLFAVGCVGSLLYEGFSSSCGE